MVLCAYEGLYVPLATAYLINEYGVHTRIPKRISFPGNKTAV